MPWKVSSLMEERLQFVRRAEAGESMTTLCQEYGIARKTGYKILQRFATIGPAGLCDQSRRPLHSPCATPPAIQHLICQAKQAKPTWGAAKLRQWLLTHHPGTPIPSRFTVHAILQRYHLVTARPRRRRLHTILTAPLQPSTAPNHVWCIDFKGQFQLGNRQLCYPLTLSDHYSRFFLSCEALTRIQGDTAQAVCAATFQEYGLPDAIRSDNGPPFASTGLFGLSVLAVWWLRLGIQLQRIAPGHPEQNGRHERLHLTLKQETTRPAGATLLQQQEQFDAFRQQYNHDRPHESLAMQCPAAHYQPSARAYPPTLPEPQYPAHDLVRTVHHNGEVRLDRQRRFHLGDAFCHQPLGLREEDVGLWKVTFMDYDLGLFDADAKQFIPFAGPHREGAIP